MRSFCHAIILLICLDAHVSREMFQVDDEVFAAEAVQLVNKPLHSDSAAVGLPEPAAVKVAWPQSGNWFPLAVPPQSSAPIQS